MISIFQRAAAAAHLVFVVVSLILGLTCGSITGQQTKNAQERKDPQFEALLAKYQPQFQKLMADEREREESGLGYGGSQFWDNWSKLQEAFDKELLEILHGLKNDPEMAFNLYIAWARGEALHGQMDRDPELLKQIKDAAPTFVNAVPKIFDQLEAQCNESNAMEVAPKMLEVVGRGEKTNTTPPDSWARYEQCARKATITLDFDSTVEMTNFPFAKATSHVRAEGAKLRYDPDKKLFVVKGYPVNYLSYEFKNQKGACSTGNPVSGTLDAFARMTLTPGEPREFVVQAFPRVREHVKVAIQVPPSDRCQVMMEQDFFNYVTGFTNTDGTSPYTMKLGSKQIINGKPWVKGEVKLTAHSLSASSSLAIQDRSKRQAL